MFYYSSSFLLLSYCSYFSLWYDKYCRLVLYGIVHFMSTVVKGIDCPDKVELHVMALHCFTGVVLECKVLSERMD